MIGALALVLLLPRPVLSGMEEHVDTADGHFRVHYTRSGMDTPVHVEDVAPANGVPDDVDATTAGISSVVERWVMRAGMRPPMPDAGAGGDERVDVYLRRLVGTRGRTHRDPSPASMTAASSAFVELDTQTASVGAERLSAAAGHEAHHVLQFAYGPNAAWLQEASATYAELSGFGGAALEAEREDHWARLLSHPGVPLDAVDGVHEYDAMAFVKFLRDRSGKGDAAIASLWEALSDGRGTWTAIEQVTGRHAPSVVLQYAGWLRTACQQQGVGGYDVGALCVGEHAPALTGLGVLGATKDVGLPALGWSWIAVPAGRCGGIEVGLADRDASAMNLAVGAASGPVVLESSSPRAVELSGRGGIVVLARGPGTGAPVEVWANALLLTCDPDGGAGDATMPAPSPGGCTVTPGAHRPTNNGSRGVVAPGGALGGLALVSLAARRRRRGARPGDPARR